jgi:hypothetical protein
MKKAKRKPTRAQREAQGTAPQLHTCNVCNKFKGTAFAVKEHRRFCNG